MLILMTSGTKRTDLGGLEALALAQGGYFDRGDAHAHGIHDRLLHYHVRTGRFARVFAGVYRLRAAPPAPHDDLLLAWVWSNYRGVISHESALALYALSDVMPSRVQLTVPPGFARTTGRFDLHRARLADDDVTTYEGLPVTTPARSIVDAAALGTGPEQIERAVRQALLRALTSPQQLRAIAGRPRYRHRRRVLPLVEEAIRCAGT
jgi:predicted transcriptional regulator of viral defense system